MKTNTEIKLAIQALENQLKIESDEDILDALEEELEELYTLIEEQEEVHSIADEVEILNEDYIDDEPANRIVDLM